MNEWTWRFTAADGSTIEAVTLSMVPKTPFPSQSDAESWVGESWPDLFAAGVESVTLLHDGEVVYADMSLRPA